MSIDDPKAAQNLLDQQRRIDWVSALNNLVKPIQPLWTHLNDNAQTPYYWMAEQTEWATDFLFHSPADLAVWYPRWLRHGIETLQCRDVLRFLGKKVPENSYGSCTGEVKIDLRDRAEGTRIKFWYGTNALKMYDKGMTDQGAIGLRIEDTKNQPHGFKVFRTKEGEGESAEKAWRPLRKTVADMERRAEVSEAAVNRLAESLATVAEPRPLGELLKPLGKPVMLDGRRKARALNPLVGKDGTLLRTLAQGQFLIQGFRNQDVRKALYGEADDPAVRRKQAATVTRQLALLKAHGLIVKVTKTHRYHLSAEGRRIVTALLAAHASDANRLSDAA